MSYHVVLHHVISCHVMSYVAMYCQVILLPGVNQTSTKLYRLIHTRTHMLRMMQWRMTLLTLVPFRHSLDVTMRPHGCH